MERKGFSRSEEPQKSPWKKQTIIIKTLRHESERDYARALVFINRAGIMTSIAPASHVPIYNIRDNIITLF